MLSTSQQKTHVSHRYGNTLGIILFGLALLLLVALFLWLNFRPPLG